MKQERTDWTVNVGLSSPDSPDISCRNVSSAMLLQGRSTYAAKQTRVRYSRGSIVRGTLIYLFGDIITDRLSEVSKTVFQTGDLCFNTPLLARV
jgi:hypothetical protein